MVVLELSFTIHLCVIIDIIKDYYKSREKHEKSKSNDFGSSYG